MTRRNRGRLAMLAGAFTMVGGAACGAQPDEALDASPMDASSPVPEAAPEAAVVKPPAPFDGSVLGTTCVMPNPPASGLPNPAMYDTSITGIVFDRLTGLMWQRAPSATTYTQAAAATACKGSTLGGYTDWRLPSVVELVSIVDFTATSPSVDAVAFPGTSAGLYWTSTLLASNPQNAWFVSFIAGQTDFVYATDSNLARCVRTAMNMAAACRASATRFKVNAAMVTDSSTGLVWPQAVPTPAQTWSAAKASCDAAGGGSRLPSLKELQTLVDYGMVYPGPGPAIDPTAFPSTPVGAYWTSSPFSGSDSAFWMVRFDYGDTASSAVVSTPAQPLSGVDTKYVRCVH